MLLFLCLVLTSRVLSSRADESEHLLFGTITFDDDGAQRDSLELVFKGGAGAGGWVRNARSGLMDDSNAPFAVRVPTSSSNYEAVTISCAAWSVTGYPKPTRKRFLHENSTPLELHVVVSQLTQPSPTQTKSSKLRQLLILIIAAAFSCVAIAISTKPSNAVPVRDIDSMRLPSPVDPGLSSTPPTRRAGARTQRSVSTVTNRSYVTQSLPATELPLKSLEAAVALPLILLAQRSVKTAYIVETGTAAVRIYVERMPELLQALETTLRTQTNEIITVAKLA